MPSNNRLALNALIDGMTAEIRHLESETARLGNENRGLRGQVLQLRAENSAIREAVHRHRIRFTVRLIPIAAGLGLVGVA